MSFSTRVLQQQLLHAAACRPSTCRAQSLPRRAVVPLAGRGSNFANNSESSDAFLNAALREAVMIFAEAQEKSKQQIKQELQESLLSNTTWSSNPATSDALQNFWIEQGLSAKLADKLVTEMSKKFPQISLDQLALKLKRLRRILPDVSAAELIFKDCNLLDLDVNTAVSNLVHLVQYMPSRNVSEVVLKEPRLLYCEDLEDRLKSVVAKLKALHPSNDEKVVIDIIVENPQLLYRIPYYTNATMLDDLPIEIQNMMLVVDDKGIGFLYKYYKERGQFTS